MKSAVIICTRNRCADLIHALRSIAHQTDLPNELIIVDSSTTPVQDEIQFQEIFTSQTFPKTKLKYVHTAPGLPKQRNYGVSLAQSDLIHFLDDDVELRTDYLHQMNKTFKNYAQFAGGMGTVENIPYSISYKLYRIVCSLFLLQRNYASGKFTLSGLPTHAYGTSTLKSVEVLGGCCMSFRAVVFKTHRFDESLSGYAFMEDCDFSRRVSFDSLLFFNPNARLKHFVSPIARDSIVDNRAMYLKNYRYLFFKNVYPRHKWRIIFYGWSIIGLFVTAIVRRDWQGLKGYWQGLKSS